MPLPSDEKLIQLGNDLLDQFSAMFGQHPGFRPAHAKGLLLKGEFTPSPEAASLTRAPHAIRASTPVVVRFSNSTGLPLLPDNEPNANPRGMAVRFYLAERVHTDIISHSTDGFPTRTGHEFLEFLRAVSATAPGMPSPTPVEAFLGAHPETLAFVQTPKPSPASFATEAYFGVTALRFLNGNGEARYGRYRITPEAGLQHLEDDAVKLLNGTYLFDEIAQRVSRGPIRFHVAVQVAGPDDVVDNATIHWPETRPLVPFGKLELNAVAPESDREQQHIIFDPIPRVDGIEASDDPLLELRAAIYLISGRRRRGAEKPVTAATTA